MWSGPHTRTAPSDLVVWNLIRFRGVTFKFVAACFQHGIAIANRNLELIQNMMGLTDGGRSEVLVVADFNMTSEQPEATGVVSAFGMVILHEPVSTGTCRLPTCQEGDRLFDYTSCTHGVARLLGEFQIHHSVLWWPDYGISFEATRRPSQGRCWQDVKPKSLPYRVDDKGDPMQYSCTHEVWLDTLRCITHYDDKDVTYSPSFQVVVAFAHKIDAYDTCAAASRMYHEWSRAAEIIAFNFCRKHGEQQQCGMSIPLPSSIPKSMVGRAAPTRTKMATLKESISAGRTQMAGHSIEYHLWSMPQGTTFAGDDLYTTL